MSRRSFDVGINPTRDPLAAAAAAITDHANDQALPGTLVVVVRPDAEDYLVVACNSDNGTLRAAVSVMIAADNPRLWQGVAHDDIVERSLASLPEVVRAAAEGRGVVNVHVGAVHDAGAIAAVAMWFETECGVADSVERHDALHVLKTAAERSAVVTAERDAEEAVARERREAAGSDPSTLSADEAVRLNVGSDHPDIDALTGLASRARFDRALDEFDADEATLLLLNLDGFAAVNDEHGTDAGDRVLREVATRLVSVCRNTDLVARLDGDEFAILLDGTDRSTGLQTSKRLLAAISEPLPADIGPERVAATLAFAHEIGLVDMEELFEMADEAVASGKRSSRGRIVIAS